MLQAKKEKVIEIINKMICCCEPIHKESFNQILIERQSGLLKNLKKDNNVVGIRQVDYTDANTGFRISTLSIIATITDILTSSDSNDKCDDGSRLAFILDEYGYIVGAKWYNDDNI
jgi:hypothetical protein